LTDTLPIVLVPGLFCTARLYTEQVPALWKFGPVTVVDHTRGETIAEIASRVLESAPSRFALAGLSMGGYVALEIVHQASGRVAKLALLDTSARPDTAEQVAVRRQQIELAIAGHLGKVVAMSMPSVIYKDEAVRVILREMAMELGAEIFVRQQNAIIGRADSRPRLASIRCPTLVLVGEQDRLIPPDRSKEIADGIAGARYVTIPECGHLSTLEQPQRVTKVLIEWLQ
jgi:pimeloyl-ACP methyl ester carboxylesterase